MNHKQLLSHTRVLPQSACRVTCGVRVESNTSCADTTQDNRCLFSLSLDLVAISSPQVQTSRHPELPDQRYGAMSNFYNIVCPALPCLTV